jgi:phosphatidylglycerol:prolipoprotein diacylglycerol transferase
MFPFRLGLGPFAITPVELFAFLGIALTAWLARRRMAALGVSGPALFDLALAALVGGAVGARLFYFVPLWLRGLESGATLFARWSEGSGFFGGLIGGSAAVLLLARLKKFPVLRVADAAAAPLPLGFALGKVGCFLAGCCYGRPCDGFPGVRFAPGSLAGSAARVHPAPLYEMALGVALGGGLAWLSKRSRRPGEVYLAFVAGYSAWRFAIEFLRADPGRHGFGAGLSDSQVTAIVLLAASAAGWVILRRKAAPPPAGAPA